MCARGAGWEQDWSLPSNSGMPETCSATEFVRWPFAVLEVLVMPLHVLVQDTWISVHVHKQVKVGFNPFVNTGSNVWITVPENHLSAWSRILVFKIVIFRQTFASELFHIWFRFGGLPCILVSHMLGDICWKRSNSQSGSKLWLFVAFFFFEYGGQKYQCHLKQCMMHLYLIGCSNIMETEWDNLCGRRLTVFPMHWKVSPFKSSAHLSMADL